MTLPEAEILITNILKNWLAKVSPTQSEVDWIVG
jgi:hypothetical protein